MITALFHPLKMGCYYGLRLLPFTTTKKVSELFSSEFTADMEKQLDSVEEGMVTGSEMVKILIFIQRSS